MTSVAVNGAARAWGPPVAVHPSGKLVYVANGSSKREASLRINAASGALTAMGRATATDANTASARILATDE